MKSMLVGALAAAASLLATSAAAQTGYVYLGGAMNLPHCQQIAGAAGYQIATFGGYVNGVYYWNGCFGSGTGGGTGGQVRKYDVYTNGDLQACAEDIQWQLGDDVRCRASWDVINCTSRRGGVKNEIEAVDCVTRAYAL